MPHGEEIDQLEQDLKRLRVEYERFFNGAIEVPPKELETDVERRIRSLRSIQLLSSVERFRLGTLEARHNTLGELFRRRLRDREIGGPAPGTGERRVAEPAGDGGDPSPIVLDPGLEEEPVERLYRELQRRTERRAVRTDIDAFRTYLGRQLDRIRERTGCSQVQMRVVSEGGRVKLKARPLRDPESAPPPGETPRGDRRAGDHPE